MTFVAEYPVLGLPRDFYGMELVCIATDEAIGFLCVVLFYAYGTRGNHKSSHVQYIPKVVECRHVEHSPMRIPGLLFLFLPHDFYAERMDS